MPVQCDVLIQEEFCPEEDFQKYRVELVKERCLADYGIIAV